MSDLIAALEKAEAGSRDLDARIEFHLLPPAKQRAIRNGTDGIYTFGRYTTSIDSALRLVPEGYDWVLYSDGCAGCAPRDPEDLPVSDHYGATPALSLCIAALKARAAIAAAAAKTQV